MSNPPVIPMKYIKSVVVTGMLGCLLMATGIHASEKTSPTFVNDAASIRHILSIKPLKPGVRSLFGSTDNRALKRVTRLRENKQGGVAIQEQVEVFASQANVKMQIRFDKNSAKLRKESAPLLKELGRALTSPGLAGIKVVVAGHTDDSGEARYNLTLSYQRAEAVRNYLVKHFKVKAKKIEIEGYGETSPLTVNRNKKAQQLNRRVEISRK